jgi:hypothetical protein
MMVRRATYRTSGKSRKSMRIDSLESRRLLSATYFVATWGSDGAPGTSNQPYRTIQQAANVANWGDTVDIFGGTYRETVRPAHSGVTFTNVSGQGVTISGADVVGGWSGNGGSVFKTYMPTDLGEGGNQLFVDGQMVNEARFPNTSPDVSHPTQATIGSYSNGILYDQSINQGNGFWNGATIHVTPGSAWVGYTGVVTNSGPGWLQVALPSLSGYEQPTSGNHYYLSGKFQALDAPGEWYRDASGTLYLWDQASDNPAWHTVEVKSRQFAFDLSGLSNTTIQGVNLFAATIYTDWSSQNTLISAINAQYLSQFNNIWGSGWSPPSGDGITLNGAGSVLQNSTIAFSAGDGVFVGNNNIRVSNNVIHDVDYSGTDAAGIRVYGNNSQIDHNLVYNTGRDGINFQGGGSNIVSNTVHDAMLQTNDGGGIYTVNNPGGGTIAYNTIYNVNTAYNASAGQYGATAIFLDNNSANFSVHHNVTANVNSGLRMNFTSYNENIYNNLFGANNYAIDSNGAYDWGGSQIHDNIFYNSNLSLGANFGAWNNSVSGGSPALPGSTTYAPPPPPPPAAPVVSPPPPAPVSPPAAAPVTAPAPAPVSAPVAAPSTPPVAGSGTSSNSSSNSASTDSAASRVPSAAPVPPQSARAVPLIGPKRPQTASVVAAAKTVAHPVTTTALQLAGTIQGNSQAKPKVGNTITGYTLRGQGTVSGTKFTSVVGTSVGAVTNGKATGTLRLATAKGALKLTLSAPAPSKATAPPSTFSYVISSGTGPFKNTVGQGTVTLTLIPAKKNAPSTFSLVLKPS